MLNFFNLQIIRLESLASSTPTYHMIFRISLFSLMLLICAAAFAAEKDTDAPKYNSNIDIQPLLINDKTTEGNNLLKFALEQVGVPYHKGGTSPETGFDCSGFVLYVFNEIKGISLPHSSLVLSKIGQRIKMAGLHPGDLVFFHINPHNSVSHVGIYLGDNRFIHDPNRNSDGVEVSTLTGYWAKHFMLGRRIEQPKQEAEATLR